MEKIDLMKCVNCRFRAKVDGKKVEGRIAVDGDYLRFFYDNGDIYSILISCYQEHGIDYFDDLEIVPRDPETYRDWQVGDRVHYPNCYNEIVIFRSGELVVLADDFTEENSDVTAVNTCSQLFDRRDGRLVLTDIENQIIEEKKKYEPQDGDVVYVKVRDNDIDTIFIFNKNVENRIYSYVGYNIKFDEIVDTHGLAYIPPKIFDDVIEYRPATEEEKKLLIDKLAKKGKRWNAEKKVVEDIPKPYEFKKGEPVLARDYDNELWALYAYHEQAGNKYIVKRCFQTVLQSQCLPYNERTMHLLGTAGDYKEV